MKRLVYKQGNGLNFLDFDQIIFLEVVNKKTIIHTVKEKIETTQSLTSVYKQLNKEIFIRTHRSYVVNINSIVSIKPWGKKSYRITFKGIEDDALFSYTRYRKFKENFG